MIDAKNVLHYSAHQTVLIVEDDANLLQELCGLLEPLFNRVVAAADAEEALTAYRTEPFDLLITDLKMPGMDGVELCRIVRAEAPEQQILVVSAYDDAQHLVPLINLNVNGFVQKPIRHEAFMQTLLQQCKIISERRALGNYRRKLEADTQKLSRKLEQLDPDAPVSEQMSFEAMAAVADRIEQDRESILTQWCENPGAQNVLRRHNIDVEFFQRFFAGKVLDFLLSVARGENEAGNCPAILVMLDFFRHKDLPLWDIFSICVQFKNSLTIYAFSHLEMTQTLFEEMSYVLDKNFEGVIRKYLPMNRLVDRESPAPAAKPDEAPDSVAEAPDSYLDYMLEHDVQELRELENDIDDLAIAIVFSRMPPAVAAGRIGEKLSRYGALLISYPVFSELGEYVSRLGNHFLNNVETVSTHPEKLANATLLLESFVNDLMLWRKEVFEIGVQDPDFLNQSFSSNVETIIGFMSDADDEDEDEIEFF